MRLIPCRKIREGMELARDVVTGPPGTAPLLRTGVQLSERYARALPHAGIGSVWIEDDLGRDIDVVEPLTPETRAKVHRVTGDALDAARNSLQHGAGLPDAVVASLAEVADALVADLLEIPEAALTLDDLSSFDAYTHRHSVQVSVLGLLLARRAWTKEGWTDYRGRQRYDRFGDRLRKLGIGLLVHDVGKLAVPPEVLNKPARLSDHFRAVVMPYPVGHEVVLPDGRHGVVAAVDPLDPDRPTVRVPQGRSVDEVKVDMTEPPAVLAQAASTRAPLPG